jgi:hypothetical protein
VLRSFARYSSAPCAELISIANIGRRRKVVAAVEARIRIQIEPLEVPIQTDLDVPHLVLRQPIALRKALSTSIALTWLSGAHFSQMSSQVRLRRERALAVRTPMSNPKNAQRQHELEDVVSLCMILCIVDIRIVLRLLLLSSSLTNSLKMSVVVVVEEQIVIATTVHQSKLMLFRFFVTIESSGLRERFSAELTEKSTNFLVHCANVLVEFALLSREQ